MQHPASGDIGCVEVAAALALPFAQNEPESLRSAQPNRQHVGPGPISLLVDGDHQTTAALASRRRNSPIGSSSWAVGGKGASASARL